MSIVASHKYASYKHRFQKAFSLLEVLLAVGILATILAIGTTITTDLARQIVNEKAARQLLVLQRAGEEFATANFTRLLTSSVAGNIATPNTSTQIPLDRLSDDGFLPNDFSAENLLNLEMLLFLRNATQSGSNPVQTIEVITVTDSAASTPRGQAFEWILDTALFGNGRIGVLSNIGTGFNNISFTSTNGTWNIPISSLSGYSPSLPTASSDPSGYIASYGRITAEDVFDPDVLYRIPIAAQPDLNQMQTNLNLNNNALRDIGTLTVDQMAVGDTTLTSTGRYALSSTDTMTFASGITSLSGDMLIYADNDAGTSDLTASSVNLGNGSLVSRGITADTASIGAGGLVANDVNAVGSNSRDLIVNNGLAMNVNSLNTTNLQIGGAAGVNTISAGTIGARNLVSGQVDVSGATNVVSGNATITNNLAISGNAIIDNLNTNQANLSNLCFTTGPQDDIEQCP